MRELIGLVGTVYLVIVVCYMVGRLARWATGVIYRYRVESRFYAAQARARRDRRYLRLS